MITRLSAVLVPLVLSLLLLTGCEEKITQSNFDKITNGMTLTQVEKLLGSGTDDTPAAGYGVSYGGVLGSKAAEEKVFVWKGKGFRIIVKLKDGKVVEKSKVST